MQLVRYGGTAGIAAIVDIAGFGVFHGLGWPVALAAATSFLLATVVNYTLTARFVFAMPASLPGYLKFLVAALLGFCINVSVTVLLAQAGGMAPVLAKTVGVGIAFFANFALNAFFVFRTQRLP
ncbi:MAG: GtrA family protein [Rhodobacteraceae bacterium]|nr:GtrA family protein [Paracoccaceae bacterium]